MGDLCRMRFPPIELDVESESDGTSPQDISSRVRCPGFSTARLLRQRFPPIPLAISRTARAYRTGRVTSHFAQAQATLSTRLMRSTSR